MLFGIDGKDGSKSQTCPPSGTALKRIRTLDSSKSPSDFTCQAFQLEKIDYVGYHSLIMTNFAGFKKSMHTIAREILKKITSTLITRSYGAIFDFCVESIFNDIQHFFL